MRTTIDLPGRQRAKLLEMAAQRGEKGFSILVQEALDLFFEHQSDRKEKLEQVLSLRGSLTEDEAEAMRERIRELRAHWR